MINDYNNNLLIKRLLDDIDSLEYTSQIINDESTKKEIEEQIIKKLKQIEKLLI